ncbi:MAG: hypothetical protein EOP51_08995 [Sphingobacteriales bacterium]|nr:MAG: hypothetical protein EOP51_08995 [Sphingobacteriales bacterium]
MPELLTYQTYSTPDEAENVAAQLNNAGISTEVLKITPVSEAVFTGTTFGNKYEIKIPAADFTKANEVLFSNDAVPVEDIDQSHPLFTMTNDELKEIVIKPKEWGPENYSTALAILKHRDVPLLENTFATQQQEKVVPTAQKQRVSTYLLLLGYASALTPIISNLSAYESVKDAAVWFFPGVAGMLVSWSIMQAKTTLPNGSRILTYDNASQKHALGMLVLNVLSWLVNGCIFLYIIL